MLNPTRGWSEYCVQQKNHLNASGQCFEKADLTCKLLWVWFEHGRQRFCSSRICNWTTAAIITRSDHPQNDSNIKKCKQPRHYLKLKNVLFILKRSWFSKLRVFKPALLGLKISPALLNSLSQAAEAGRGVFSFTDNLRTAGKDFRKLLLSAGHVIYPSSCLVL